MIVKQDIQVAFGGPYAESAPKVLGDQHNFLLNTLDSYLTQQPNPVLLIVGSGAQVLPYSRAYTAEGMLGDSNRDRISKMIRNGKVLLLDYVVEREENGLLKGRNTLELMGFFEHGYFSEGEVYEEGILDLNNLENRTIAFLKNNLKEDLRLPDATITAVDANLSVHHASVTRHELERIYSEFFRILKPGGMLHLGEGDVDMNYTENKVIQIGQDLVSILNVPTFITDDREVGNGYEICAFFEPGETYDDLPVIPENLKPESGYASVRITEDGLVFIRATTHNQVMLVDGVSEEVAQKLKERGYKQMFVFSDSIVMPLMDPEMLNDREYIHQVGRYYAAIKERAKKGYSGIDDVLVAQISAGVEFEKGNARRGVIEYYMSERTIVDTLKKVGFIDIQVTHHEAEPFYNITAKKPL